MSAKAKNQDFTATGRRKTSTARVRIRPGSGSITINNRDINDYCSTEQQKKAVIGPLLCVYAQFFDIDRVSATKGLGIRGLQKIRGYQGVSGSIRGRQGVRTSGGSGDTP